MLIWCTPALCFSKFSGVSCGSVTSRSSFFNCVSRFPRHVFLLTVRSKYFWAKLSCLYLLRNPRVSCCWWYSDLVEKKWRLWFNARKTQINYSDWCCLTQLLITLNCKFYLIETVIRVDFRVFSKCAIERFLSSNSTMELTEFEESVTFDIDDPDFAAPIGARPFVREVIKGIKFSTGIAVTVNTCK